MTDEEYLDFMSLGTATAEERAEYLAGRRAPIVNVRGVLKTPNNRARGDMSYNIGAWRLELVKQGISNRAFQAAVNYMRANDIKMDKVNLHTIAAEFEGEFRL